VNAMSIAKNVNREANIMNMNNNRTAQLSDQRNLRIKEVIDVVGLSRNTIYRLMEKFQFPKKVKLSQGLVGWRIEEIKIFLELGPDGWYEKHGIRQQAEKQAKQA